MVGQNPQRSGRSPFRGPHKPHLAWSERLVNPVVESFHDSGSTVADTIVVGADAQLYLTRDVGILEAFDDRGHLRWRSGASVWPMTAPTMLPDGSVLHCFGGNQPKPLCTVFLFEADGRLRWKHEMPGWQISGSPLAPGDGSVYLTAQDMRQQAVAGKLMALDTSGGGMLWEIPLEPGFVRELALTLDGKTLIGAGPNNFSAVSTKGQPVWSIHPPAHSTTPLFEPYDGPAICPDGRILVVSGRESPQRQIMLDCYDPAGKLLWQSPLQGMASMPAVTASGEALLKVGDGK